MTFLRDVDRDVYTEREPEATAASCGYVCKRCSGPAPTGVGYASSKVPCDDARLSCDCGYSVKAIN